MAPLALYKDNYVDSTVVSNCFIDEYMKDANDAQLKVYLYLIRMLNANQAISVSGIADKFNHTEKDVIRALKYCEKNTLLTLDYDEDKNLVGIHLRDLDAPVGGRNIDKGINAGAKANVFVTPAPSATHTLPTETVQNSFVAHTIPANTMQNSFVPDAAMPNISEATEPASPYAKPAYTADHLREFKNRNETAQLLFIAETYIGKPLTPSEMKSMIFFTDVLHFSFDLIDYLLQYCVDRGKKDFKYIEKVAINWAEEGISTPKQAQRYSTRYDKNVYAIMNALGKSSTPTPKELEYINRWTKEYCFSMDIIFEACGRTVMATDKHRFEYAEGILSNWKKEDVHHKADIRKIDDLYQKRRSNARPATGNGGNTTSGSTTNRFNQFTQNSYDFDALEKEILSN